MLENLKLWEELLWDAEGRDGVKPDEGKKHGVCVCLLVRFGVGLGVGVGSMGQRATWAFERKGNKNSVLFSTNRCRGEKGKEK